MQEVLDVFSVIAPWVVIFFLFTEKWEKSRPYLQVSFDLVRGPLACIIIKNVGSTPAELKSMKFNQEFVKQLSQRTQARLKKQETKSLIIYPNRQHVISLDVIVNSIINDFECKIVSIDTTYSRRKKSWFKFSEKLQVDFEEYGGFLLYISEQEELKRSVDGLTKGVKDIVRSLDKTTTQVDRYIACSQNSENE